MRSEVIDRILSVEDEAQDIRNRAEAEAQKIVADAQSSAAIRVKEATADERRKGDETIEAQSAATDERIRAMESGSGDPSSSSASLDQDRIADAVQRIASLVCSVALFED